MIKMYSAKKDGNGYVPYGTAFRFNDLDEAKHFVKHFLTGKYLAYEVTSYGDDVDTLACTLIVSWEV